MINKAFQPSKNRSTLILSSIGTVIGLCLLLIAIQVYTDINTAIQQNNDDQYLVLKKKISTFNTLGMGASNFTTKNIEELRKQSFVTDLAPFKSGSGFEVMVVMSFEGGNFPPFSTLAFFESIPNRFIDVDTKDWGWEKGTEEVPIILPNTFLDAYNYGIAPSMGAPQASKSLIGSVRFKLKIRGHQKDVTYYGRVVNFSDRVNSILVPDSFLNYLNQEVGNQIEKDPSRLIIATPNKADPSIKAFLKQQNYETNTEQLKESLIQQVTSSLFYFLMAIGLIIVFLAVVIFILYTQVIINKSQEEIKVLLLLGYTWQQISQTLLKLFIKVYGIIIIISLSIVFLFKYLFAYWLLNKIDLQVPNSIATITFVTGLAFILLFLLINYISISRSIKSLAKK
ncbi:MAG: hypothetical protein N4A35_07160 [Flavobacteriales bacterium]|jgi:hypothetical protein|nr:hypothetical protein [Flavobacteriales bacterium]